MACPTGLPKENAGVIRRVFRNVGEVAGVLGVVVVGFVTLQKENSDPPKREQAQRRGPIAQTRIGGVALLKKTTVTVTGTITRATPCSGNAKLVSLKTVKV